MSTQWTDADNVHALGGAACTHQREVADLQKQKSALMRDRTALRAEADGKIIELEEQVNRLKDALAGMSRSHQNWCPALTTWPYDSDNCICGKKQSDAALAALPEQK